MTAKIIGGSDVCETCAAHCVHLEDLLADLTAEREVREKLVVVAERLEKLMVFLAWESQVQESGTISTDDPMPEAVLLPPLRTDVADALAAARKLEDPE